MPEEKTVIVVQQGPSAAIGICALIFSIISLFFMAILFIPIALILAVIAIVKKQVIWGVCAIIISIISACFSPTIWAIFVGLGLSQA